MSAISPAVLSRVSLFGDLAVEDLETLAGRLRRRSYSKGQVIFGQGDPGTCLYIVESGWVKISLISPEGKELVLNALGSGDFFGELALLDGEPRSADAVAQDPCQLLLLQRDDFLRLLEARPHMAIRLLAVVSHRLRRTTQQAQDAAFLDVPARLARSLLDLAETRGKPDPDGGANEFPVTQVELAAIIGATRESVNKWLGHYEAQGLILRRRGHVTLLRPETLRQRIY